MPFGLMNGPAAFQQFINDILGNMLDVCAIGYLDDILIYLDLLDQYRSQVREVLMHLQKVGLFANPKKCKFHTDTVEYLGFIMSLEGLRMDPAKVTTILKWPEPIFSSFCQFLQTIHQQLLQDDPTTHLTLQKKCGLVIRQR